MQITVYYMASLREAKGVASEVLETEAATPADVVDTLDLPLGREHLRVAVNNAFVDWETRLEPGDELLFVPPVAGG